MPSASLQNRLFVSHISEEAAIAKLLKEQMEHDFLGQVSVFTSSDIGSIAAGKEWLDAIQSALDEAVAVLVLCSKASISRPWVQFELGAAWMRHKPVIPVCHSGLKVEALPLPLSRWQGIRLDSEFGIKRLYDGVAKILKWPRPPQAGALCAFIEKVNELEGRVLDPVQQFERFIDIVIPRPGTLDEPRIPESTRVESNEVSFELFGFIGNVERTWGDISKAAHRTRDVRWLAQLQECIYHASHNVAFRPVQAIYHNGRAAYQPQLAKKETHADGSCRYHVHFVETTVAPLTEVNNSIGLLATLLRLGLRFRYEVVERFYTQIKILKAKPEHVQAAEIGNLLTALRGAIEIIEIDVSSRGAQNFKPDEIVRLFDNEEEQHEIVRLQTLWNETRALIFRADPPLIAADLETGIDALRDMNYRFSCLATRRFHEKVSSSWAARGASAPAKPLEPA
jgi:MTH538 TIR-like domain (DUF1863).